MGGTITPLHNAYQSIYEKIGRAWSKLPVINQDIQSSFFTVFEMLPSAQSNYTVREIHLENSWAAALIDFNSARSTLRKSASLPVAILSSSIAAAASSLLREAM